jgi:hypothetical protein
MATETGPRKHSQDKALAPIRWPHPGRPTLTLIALWTVGLLLAVFVPALIVAPTEGRAPTGEVLLALSCTLVGAAVMAGVGFTFLRRHEDPVATAFGVVPAITVTIGGLIMAATKLTGA